MIGYSHPIKNRWIILAFVASWMLGLFACTPATDPTQIYLPISQVSGDLAKASSSLHQFFELLHAGQYQEAAKYYGGSYEVLQGYNPDVDPQDYSTLWSNGCQFNGFQCLKIKNIVEEVEVSPSEFRFIVEFQNPDGSLFVQGPCCGATEEEMPPVSQFEYTVIKTSEGNFLVQEMPVYVP